MKIQDPFQDISKATKALKAVLEADQETIDNLPPLERLLAKQIRESYKGETQ